MDKFTSKDAIASFSNIDRNMRNHRDYLIEIDGELGDGDLGLTMTKGAAAAVEAVGGCAEDDVGAVLKKAGFAIAKAAPSTMGTLMATGFIAAGKALAGNSFLDSKGMALMMRSIAESVKERGKANEGDKTILDILFPVARAMEKFEGGDLTALMKEAVATADGALEKTKEMINQHGKAAVFREKSLGRVDPGSSAVVLVIKGFAEACGAFCWE